MRIVLLASGNGSLAQSIIDAKQSGGLNLEILELIADKECVAIERAKAAGIPTRCLPMLKNRSTWDNQIFEAVSNLNPDLVVSVGFMRILSAPFVSKFPTINTHPALLPSASIPEPSLDRKKSRFCHKMMKVACMNALRLWNERS